MLKFSKLRTYVDLLFIGASACKEKKEDWNKMFDNTKNAMIFFNNLCEKYNFPLIYPKDVDKLTDKEIYKICCDRSASMDDSVLSEDD